MIKIAMLGSDSSHTDAYCELTNISKSNISRKANVEILWGENFNETKEKAKKYNIKSVSKNLEDINFENIDLVMVVGRFGNSHFEPAKLAIENKIPTFVDKPFTNNLLEAIDLAESAKKNNSKLISFSPLRFADEIILLRKNYVKNLRPLNLIVTSPLITKTVPGEGTKSIYFYSIHAVDICLSLIKSKPESLIARRVNDAVMADLVFENGSSTSLNLTYNQKEIYHVISFEDGFVNSINIDPYGKYYANTLDYLLNYFHKGDKEEFNIDQAIDSIAIIDAIERSLDQSKKVGFN